MKLSFCCVVGCLQRKRRQTDRRKRMKIVTAVRTTFPGIRSMPKIRMKTRSEHKITISRVILKQKSYFVKKTWIE